MLTAVPVGLLSDVPVDPNGDEARKWLIDELAKPEYAQAQPTWFDRLSAGFFDWLSSLKFDIGDGFQAPVLAVVGVVILAALVTAFLIFGPPRLGRRSTVAGALFGKDDARGSDELRRAATAAARSGDWATAIEELFRALARGLAERTIVTTMPGTTAREFSVRAGDAFPQFAAQLTSVAAVFDGVRYLGAAGTEAGYRDLEQLETAVRAARPAQLEPVGAL
ncbi:DUF4129 domain-containing protein [soil metagenome]